MRARSSGSLPSCSMRLARSSTSLGGTMKPSMPSRTTEPALGVTTLGKPRGECLVGHDGGAFEQRRKHEDVGRGHPRGHFGLRDPPERLDQIEIGLERAEVCRQWTEKLEPPAGTTDSPPGFEQVLDSLAMADSPGEEESAVLARAAFRRAGGTGGSRPHRGSRGSCRRVFRAAPEFRRYGPTERARDRPARGRGAGARAARPGECGRGARSQVNRHEIGR